MFEPGKWYLWRGKYWWLVHRVWGTNYVEVDIAPYNGKGWRERCSGSADFKLARGPYAKPPRDILLSYVQWKVTEAAK